MAIKQLDNLVSTGKLKSGRARLVDAERTGLRFESRFDLAYTPLTHWRWRRCVSRYRAEYEGYLTADQKLLEGVIKLARDVEKRVVRMRSEVQKPRRK